MQINKGLGHWSVAAVLIVWVVVVLTVSFFYFFTSIDKHIEEHATASLRDVSKGIAELLQVKIQDQWATLAPVAKYAGKEKNLLDSENLIQIMKYMKTTSNFSQVFIANHAGNSVNNDGIYINVADRYYFKKAMQGDNNISQILQSRGTGKDVFVFASPVYSGFRVRGALCASIEIKDFRKLADFSAFYGMGFTYIVDGSGKILVEPNTENPPIKGDNAISCLTDADIESSIEPSKLREDMRHREKGYFTFVSNGNVQSVYYMPLEINDWYILCGVPYEYLNDQSSQLYWIALLLSFGVFAAFIPVILIIWMGEKARKTALLHKNKELQLNEERFRIISSLSDTVIFEADLENRTMIVPEVMRAGTDYEPEIEGLPYSLVEKGYIHPDDAEAFISLHKNIPPFTKTLSGEFRIKGMVGDYMWHKIEEVLISDENGKAFKSIGRALNIDDEKRKMELLEAKTQTDSGSGLYNKQATELSVRQCIKEETDTGHAMIIMDIDNFKAINDSRGHLFGDKVIEDLASILIHQFRATDILGRIGGDEFMLFIKDIPDELFVADKIKTIHNTMMIMHKISISSGIAIYPKDGTSYLELYENADRAMYFAKKDSGECMEFYSEIEKDQ